ncbi:extracellular solute-binding protein [Paenibacillus macerans]|uniref:ABC transporter substrate-binding protein n=1 Tax=Paenibacillus macerans TaxID=44252 RepID=UPI002E239DC1|nr:extracellular solute-binding protein [Paenibacillus macerans]
MKRGWSLAIGLFVGMALFGFFVLDRSSLIERGEEGEIAPAKIQVKIALNDWADNLEVRNAIRRYNETNPDGTEIVIMDIPAEAYNDTLNMLLTSGKGPDVFVADRIWLASYVNKNDLENLKPYLSQSEIRRYPQWSLDYAQSSLFKGGIYFLPTSVETLRLIYRKDLFKNAGLDPDRPPATLAELKTAAEQITATGGGVRKYGFALPAGDLQHSFQFDLEMSNTYSGVFYYDYRTGKYDLSVYLPWLKAMREIKRAGSLYPGESLLKRENALKQFAEGNIGMMYATSRDYVKIREYAPRGDWGIAMPPATSEELSGAGALMLQPQSPLVVNSGASAKEQAVKVWRFLQSADFQSVLFQQALAIPLVDDIVNRTNQQPQYAQFKDFYPTAQEAFYPLWPQIMDQYDPNTVAPGPRNSGDRPRMELYLQLIADQEPLPMEEALRRETERLNQMLEIAATGRFFNPEDYIYPDFDPLHPLAEGY